MEAVLYPQRRIRLLASAAEQERRFDLAVRYRDWWYREE